MTYEHRDDTAVGGEEPRRTSSNGGWDEASLDAAYVPIRSFSEWANVKVDEDAWNRYLAGYNEALAVADPEGSRPVKWCRKKTSASILLASYADADSSCLGSSLLSSSLGVLSTTVTRLARMTSRPR
jgi:hypothetical protein